jgi:hypothetical protein
VAGDGGCWVLAGGSREWWWGEVGCAVRCGSDNVQKKLFGARGK